MPLIHDIQADLLDDSKPISPILLKLKFLSLRIGSIGLERWVKYELDGYPLKVAIPDYRVTSIGYSGTFSDGFSIYNDLAVSSHAVAKLVGDDWINYKIRESIAIIDSIVADERDDKQYGINTGALRSRVGNKIFTNMQCIELRGIFGVGSFIHIQHSVRARALEAAVKLETVVPEVLGIEIGARPQITKDQQQEVTQIVQQVFYGRVSSVNNATSIDGITVQVNQGESDDLVKVLQNSGVDQHAINEILDIVREEDSKSDNQLGERAKKWIKDKIEKGSGLVAGASVEVAKNVAIEAIKQYYGLK